MSTGNLMERGRVIRFFQRISEVLDSTTPYLHDGRATTITEAILEHGGEALATQNAFRNLTQSDQEDLIAFLNNLVLFKTPEE